MKCGTHQRANFAMIATQAAYLDRARAALPGCAKHATFTYECHQCANSIRHRARHLLAVAPPASMPIPPLRNRL